MWELTNEEFTGLMQQYQKLIYTVCLQFVHEPHTAEDLTQDTFLSAFSAIDRCEPQYYKQWLVRVAANKCKDHLKSAWVRKVDVPGDDALPEPRGAPGSDADDPAQSVADRAGAAELETLVRGLREPYGKIAVLYFLEHRETAEIAKLVGRPPATVNSQLWRAKLLLRQQITEDIIRTIQDRYSVWIVQIVSGSSCACGRKRKSFFQFCCKEQLKFFRLVGKKVCQSCKLFGRI